MAAAKSRARGDVAVLIYAVFAAGLCSIVYELLIATTAAYFQGDAVLYFSLTIGLYMAAMGMGAYASKRVRRALIARFVTAEIALGALGGLAVPMLYLAYGVDGLFIPVYVALTLAIGFLIGLEIPFLTRLLDAYGELRETIAHVLSLDYLGALIATVAFPLALLPVFGVFVSSLAFGLANMTIGAVILWRFRSRFGEDFRRRAIAASVAVAAVLIAGLALSDMLTARWSQSLYEDRVVHQERTRHQQIVITANRGEVRLYLDGNLQASSRDEHRYHEALVGVGLAAADDPRRVLVLGGGDGLAVRRLADDPRVEAITLIDLDPAIVRLARTNVYLTEMNGDALAPRPGLSVIHDDAVAALRGMTDRFDLILADLPDPNSTALARLYTRETYRLIRNRLAPGGAVVVQATSPVHAPDAFWGIVKTVDAAFPYALPYHALVPSFGAWGFVLARETPIEASAVAERIAPGGRYLTPEVFLAGTVFAPDILEARGDAQISTIDRPRVLADYRAGWRSWGR